MSWSCLLRLLYTPCLIHQCVPASLHLPQGQTQAAPGECLLDSEEVNQGKQRSQPHCTTGMEEMGLPGLESEWTESWRWPVRAGGWKLRPWEGIWAKGPRLCFKESLLRSGGGEEKLGKGLSRSSWPTPWGLRTSQPPRGQKKGSGRLPSPVTLLNSTLHKAKSLWVFLTTVDNSSSRGLPKVLRGSKKWARLSILFPRWTH